MTFDEGLVTAPPGAAERTFFTEAARVAEARSWVRRTLPDACGARDDYLVVVSELLGNCVVHGLPGDATLTVGHVAGFLTGRLVHRMPPSGHVGFTQGTVTEMRRLADPAADPGFGDLDFDELAESGRGLPLVVMLCEGSVVVEEHPDQTVTRWTVPGCACP
ncbi:hypothetical protein EDD29_8745 [Actinocorallia herbida]|uniref:Anti-sigma regulatory factor (Ser/Thr protein kinase) n=1 Tax=Actinocorallia herbida TaxID=58109 RepID=A0A3N1DBV5_9ACTN|nr:hypothetical protein [Actinocorallia herbida]ROO91003.1 hypothetical protein EDD29_8745 [Actinocorallia herbida]